MSNLEYKEVGPELLENIIVYAIENNLNVQITGESGFGKTAIVKSACERINAKLLYRSAPTLDVYTDLIGIPRVLYDDSNKPYIEYVRPKDIIDEKPNVIFIDEFNRAKDPKIRDCCMELMNTKSINGEPLAELKCVITALNPSSNTDYQVDLLDKAHELRNHIKVTLKNTINKLYFLTEYGEEAVPFIDWWIDHRGKFGQWVPPRNLEHMLQTHIKNKEILAKDPNAFVLDLSCMNSKEVSDSLMEYINKWHNGNNNLEATIRAISNNKIPFGGPKASLDFIKMLEENFSQIENNEDLLFEAERIIRSRCNKEILELHLASSSSDKLNKVFQLLKSTKERASDESA